jgi:hypothetical protein
MLPCVISPKKVALKELAQQHLVSQRIGEMAESSEGNMVLNSSTGPCSMRRRLTG